MEPSHARNTVSHRPRMAIAISPWLASLMMWAYLLAAGPCGMARSASAAPSLPATMRLDITLDGAIWSEASPANNVPVRVKLERVRGEWDRLVMADSRRLQQGDHWGALTGVDLSEAGGSCVIALRIEPDPWTKTAGYASYEITLKQGQSGLEGTWEGTFNGTPAKGAARVVMYPLAELPTSKEHPCLLFRSDQLRELKARAETPWGKAWLARIETAIKSDPEPTGQAVGHGLMFQLTGDKARVEAARQCIEKDVVNWNNVMYVHGAAARVVLGSLAFDLIAPACDAEFRQRMREVFRRKCRYLYYPPVGGFNPNDGSNWSVMYRSALGLAALSTLVEPAKAVEEPPSDHIIEPKPAGGEDAAQAVPLEPGKNISTWLYSGPVDVPFGADATAIKVEKQEFKPLDPKYLLTAQHVEKYRNPKLLGGVEFASLAGRRYFTANYLSTVLTVEKAGLYSVEYTDGKMEQVVVTLGGEPMANGALVRLAPGRYPVRVLASIGVVGNWEIIEWYMRLNAVTDSEADIWMHDRKLAMAHAAAMRKALGENTDIASRRWLGVARQRAANWAETALGENGWNMEGEAYTQHSLRCVLPFEQAFRNVQGHSVFQDDRVGRMFAQSVAKTIFADDRVTMPSYGPGGGPLGLDNWGRGLFIVPEKQRGAALWAWSKTLALADVGKFKMTEGLVDKFDTLAAVGQFLNFWPETKEVNPAEVLPRVLVDKKKGAYVFRNRWQDGDDFVTTLFLDSDPESGGWRAPDWADFRVCGLGTEWAARGIAWGNGASSRSLPNPRLYGNVLYVPEAFERGNAGAVTTHFASSPDGSGTVSASLDDVYLGVDPATKKPADIGVRGTRALAVDYSGVSGAPCLIVVADKVTGTKGENIWQFCTLPEHTVTVAENGFTIRSTSGATLVARVITPRATKITAQAVTIRHENNYHGKHSQSNIKRQVVSVPGSDAFLVVLTIQPGAAPEIKADGAKVIVGKRTVRLDGDKLMLE